MTISKLAGKTAPTEILEDIAALKEAYYRLKPDPNITEQQVSFGTSGHRGCSLKQTFNEHHIATISQAIIEYRQQENINGPIYIGMDTHALSAEAQKTAIEVFVANKQAVIIQGNGLYTPTPVISHAILEHNKDQTAPLADGVVITPSHNPPADGGFKYNLTHGGPADEDTTNRIQQRANELLAENLEGVQRLEYSQAIQSKFVTKQDLILSYVKDLETIVDMQAIKKANLKLGVDPMGGAGIDYWQPIADYYDLDISIVNDKVDPQFGFMPCDHDGKIRMDCSSPYAMAKLIDIKDQFDLGFANDPDADRHGIVTPTHGIMNPNHYLSVAIHYLATHRSSWNQQVKIGKTLVSSSMIDRVVTALNKNLYEVPVGFKWFVEGLFSGEVAFGGEESAGASFLRFDGSSWSTDKDGLILNLLAAEILAVTGKNPSQYYQELTEQFGSPLYKRIDAPATPAQKEILKKLSAEMIQESHLAGHKITAKLSHAQGNNAAIGGLKVTTEKGWFAARPSGTEDIYKIYAESFIDETHLNLIIKEAQDIVLNAMTNR
jgi:phosphoglucomutase